MSIKTQNHQILSWLKRGKSITALSALEKFGCMRLSARIYDLSHEGHNIHRSMVKINGKRVARYYLAS